MWPESRRERDRTYLLVCMSWNTGGTQPPIFRISNMRGPPRPLLSYDFLSDLTPRPTYRKQICTIIPSTFQPQSVGSGTTVVRLENNAKYRYPKNWLVKGLCGRCFIFLRTPPLLWPHTTPPPLTHSIRVYYTLIHTGKGGGGRANQREDSRDKISQRRSKIPTWVTVSPV